MPAFVAAESHRIGLVYRAINQGVRADDGVVMENI